MVMSYILQSPSKKFLVMHPYKINNGENDDSFCVFVTLLNKRKFLTR